MGNASTNVMLYPTQCACFLEVNSDEQQIAEAVITANSHELSVHSLASAQATPCKWLY